MGFFYSMGINFDDIESAEDCKSKVENYHITLSDSTTVDKHIYIYEERYKDSFQVAIFPQGLQYMSGHIKLASPLFFYEIRARLYEFLFTLEINYNHALFEFEGADNFLDADVAADINRFGIGNMCKGDDNAASLIPSEPLDYDSKRYLDGLVISNAIYNAIDDKSNFKEFKKGYMWLPVRL